MDSAAIEPTAPAEPLGDASDTGLTAAVAAWCDSVELASLPPEALTVARHCVLDWLGVALAGAGEPLVDCGPQCRGPRGRPQRLPVGADVLDRGRVAISVQRSGHVALVVVRRNAVLVLMGLELILNAAAINFVGLIALLLMTLGLYGTIAHNVARRSFEIGIRRALGARDRLQHSLSLSPAKARAWVRRVRAERRSLSIRQEPRRR